MKKLHPEQQDDELFIGNWQPWATDSCGWQSKRLGEVAYDARAAAPLKGMHPMFVLRSEVEQRAGATEWESERDILLEMIADGGIIFKKTAIDAAEEIK